jgi:hypothetical protein
MGMATLLNLGQQVQALTVVKTPKTFYGDSAQRLALLLLIADLLDGVLIR